MGWAHITPHSPTANFTLVIGRRCAEFDPSKANVERILFAGHTSCPTHQLPIPPSPILGRV